MSNDIRKRAVFAALSLLLTGGLSTQATAQATGQPAGTVSGTQSNAGRVPALGAPANSATPAPAATATPGTSTPSTTAPGGTVTPGTATFPLPALNSATPGAPLTAGTGQSAISNRVPARGDSATDAFRALDPVNRGYVTRAETDRIDGFTGFDNADTDRDGRLTAEEFFAAWQRYSP